MSAQKGRDMLVKLVDSSGGETTLAGLRTKTFTLNARQIDITDSDSAGQWRELLPGGGVKTLEVSGSGIFRDSASDATAREAFFDQRLLDCRLILPDFGQIDGPFQISSLRYSGQYAGEAGYDITLASAGALSFTAL